MNNDPSEDQNAHTHNQKQAILAVCFEVTDKLFREWMPHLTEGELKLFGFVLTHTLSRGKLSGHYYEDQLLNGIPKADGTGTWGVGTGLGRASLYRALKSTVDRGLIVKKSGRGAGWVLSINANWKPDTVNTVTEGNVVSIKLPIQTKKQHGKLTPKQLARLEMTSETEENEAIDEAIVGLNLILDQSQFDTHSKTTPFLEQPSVLTTFEPPADLGQPEVVAGFSVEKITEEVQKNSYPKPHLRPVSSATPVSKILPGPSNKSGQQKSTNADDKRRSFETMWKDAWKEAHASGSIVETRIPASFSVVERKIVATVAQKWDEKAYGPFEHFIQFVVSNWKTIMRKHFAWMTANPPPAQPTIQFLVNAKFLPRFIEAFCSAETLKWVGLNPQVGREIEWQMENGLTREAAAYKVAEARLELADREKRAADIESAKRHYDMAKIALERSRKEIAAAQKHSGANRPPKDDFTPKTDRDPNAPIIAETADFSAWDLK